MKTARLLYLGFFLLFAARVSAQVFNSPLSAGKWAKFSVAENGVYKIDFNQLKNAGFNVESIDPRNIKLYGNGNGMLPQARSEARTNMLQEIAIQVNGESDGKFNNGDFILFYGEGPDKYFYDAQRQIFNYENNLYDDKNFYFLTVSEQAGKRIANQENLSGDFTLVTSFNDFIYHELDNHNELNSGRQWFGEQFDISTTLELTFEKPGIIDGSEVKIVSGVMGQTFNPASFNLTVNGNQAINQPIPTILNTQYGVKGRMVVDTVTVLANNLGMQGSNTQRFRYQYTKGSSGRSIGYLDFLLVNIVRGLSLYGDQTIFTSGESLNNPTSRFEVNGVNQNVLIWDVTDPFTCLNQVYQLNSSKAIFSTPTNSLKQFIVFDASKSKTPVYEKEIANQNLFGKSSSFLIVTNSDFLAEAQRLANHRESKNGISTLVVTTEEIFNDFSGGKQDPAAIRDFAEQLYSRGLKNLLLFGRSSYDYKNRVNKNTNLVPTYESRNSLSPLETYSSDDYFGFLEIDEGEWSESPAISHTLDIGVGRLPVKSREEAANIVDKLIAYDNNPKAMGFWRKEILFVADDGDFNLHQSDADKMAQKIETEDFQLDTKKLYLDAFKQVSKPSGQVSPDARAALLKSIKKGNVIVNFTGHGSEKIWLQEQILDEDLIDKWDNKNVFPLLVTATCEFGRHDDPSQISSSELALIRKDGGAIGFVTASRPVNAASNAFLNNAFYESLFTREDGRFRDLGSVFRDTKNNSLNGVSNRNYALLADPSMHLAIPDAEIIATKISTVSGDDTLKALSKVVVEGEVRLNNVLDNTFQGTLVLELKDKEFLFNTFGDENPVFTYKSRSNTLFRGQATVSDGVFHTEFILPKNIAYQVGTGKLSMYAKNNSNTVDAIGGATDFKIGESENDDGSDKTPPQINVFIGDTTFVNGGIASSNTRLVARLFDVSGINIANYGVGNNLVAVLDNDQVFELGEYYLSDVDDFSKGTIEFPIEGLEPGLHTLEVRAWDVYNNGGSASVTFVVTGENQLAIEDLRNYPNPFFDETTFLFTHNRSGEDLQVFASIVDMMGQPVATLEYVINDSQYLVTLPPWNGTNTAGTKLSKGLYLLRVTVRSLLDGSKNEHISRLIISN